MCLDLATVAMAMMKATAQPPPLLFLQEKHSKPCLLSSPRLPKTAPSLLRFYNAISI